MDRDPPRHLHIILNPASGGGAGRRVRAELEDRLGQLGADFRIEESRHRGHAADLAECAARAGAPVVVAAGGDGTIHEVANGLLRSDAETVLGLVPVGSGNDFVKNVPGTRRRAEAIETLVRGTPGRYDAALMLTRDGTEFFVNAAGTGIDVEVVRQIEKLRGMPGAAMYVLGLGRALLRFRPISLAVRIGEQPPQRRTVMLAAVSNGCCLGGAFRLSPGALADDGQLDLCIVEKVGPLTALGLAPRVLRGRHESHRRVITARDTTFEFESAGGEPLHVQMDGELRRVPEGRVRFEVQPGRLQVLARAANPIAGTS